MTISVCICTYGDTAWSDLAWSRAYPSVLAQAEQPLEIIVEHQPDGNIASTRNRAAADAKGTHIIFCDADDELDSGYVHAMNRALPHDGSTLLTPRVSYIVKNRVQAPKFWPEKPLSEGNWMVIGTMVQRQQFLAVGGFADWPHAFEDWHILARLWKAGAEIVKVPNAIYRAHWTPGSRNKKMTREEAVRLHYELGREIFPDEYPQSWLDTHLGNARRMARRT